MERVRTESQADSQRRVPSDYLRERKNELVEQLDWKIDAISDFEHSLRALNVDTPPAEVQAGLDTAYRVLVECFPAEAAGGLARIQEVAQQFIRNTKSHKSQPEKTTNQERLDYIHAQVKLIVERELLLKNDNTRILSNIFSVTKGFKEKNEQVHAVKNNPTELLTRVHELNKAAHITMDDIIEVEMQPFEVRVTVAESAYDQIMPMVKSLGLHWQQTPFSLIRNGPPATLVWVKHHESVHNFIDAARDIKNIFPKQFQEENSRLFWIGSNTADKEEFLQVTAPDIIDQLHNETLTSLDRMETTILPAIRKKELDGVQVDYSTLDFHGYAPGRDVQGILSTLDRLEFSAPDPDVRAHAKKLIQDARSAFNDMMASIVRALDAVPNDPTGEALRRAHILFFLLPPTKYRHIERYLQHKYGKQPAKNYEKVGKNGSTEEPENGL